MNGVFNDVGWVQQVIFNQRTGVLIDGHMRVAIAKERGVTAVPVTVVDLSEHEEATVLATLDPIGALAEADVETLDSLLRDIGAVDRELQETITNMAKEAGVLSKLEKKKDQREYMDKEALDRLMSAGTLEDLAPSDEELEILGNRRMVVEFSGGKDSSAAAAWVKKYFPDNIELVYVDLGSEFYSMRSHLQEAAEWLNAKLHVVRSKKNILHAFLEKGEWPRPHFPYCHTFLQEAFDTHMNANYDPEEVVLVRGGRLAEATGRRGVVRQTRFMDIKRTPYLFFQPCYFGKKDLCERILAETGMPVWQGYQYGLCRTACWICPGQRTEAYAAIRDNYPELWEELLWFEKRLGVGTWSPSNGFVDMADRGQARYEKRNSKKFYRGK